MPGHPWGPSELGGCPAGAVYGSSDTSGSNKMVGCPIRRFPRQRRIPGFGEEGAALAQEPFCFYGSAWAGDGPGALLRQPRVT